MASNSSSSKSSNSADYNLNSSRNNLYSSNEHPTSPSSVERSVNVDDAYSYLNQVKMKYLDQPEVYQQFLDIMKEFKTQTLDTLGVIDRVAALFSGHSALISGFNTFLPSGFRIEPIQNDLIRVTRPDGTITVISQPVEFNHAMQYINKIKSRFQPEIYTQFLDILQSYQNDQKSIQETYAQVEILFDGANDLLIEFKQFLPQHGTKRKNHMIMAKQKRAKTVHIFESDIRFMQPNISVIESRFFKRVKEYIGNEQTYFQFLRVLNLFTQQVLDATQLIEQSESYISGNKELYDHLKLLVGYDPKDRITEKLAKFDSVNQECGPSYRSVPDSWKKQSCSGRDSLCWDVLNDDYVSHPTWASEDSGFISSKKNQFEEALHRVEDERYDYDLNIDTNLNTITLLEPISKRIQSMTEKEKNNFKLDVGIGGPSKAIYQRIIKKIYGAEQGTEILDMLHNNPAQTVPVIMKRLKQKDEEWRQSQREWNKAWKEIEIKNYFKALDYQGVTFKALDKRLSSTKHLINQIEAIRTDQLCDNITTEPQFIFNFKDKNVPDDIITIMYSHLKRQTIYTRADISSMKKLIETFLPAFFSTPKDRKKAHHFFGNNAYYCFFRLFQICYERLYKMKEMDNQTSTSKLMNKSELELNITSDIYQMIEKDFEQGSYETLLALIERYFNNEIDQNVFEECTRYLFGTEAYILYTIDKLVTQLVRQLHQIITDTKSQQILAAFTKNQGYEKDTIELIKAYRLEITELLGENDNLYHFTCHQHLMCIQLLEKDDDLFELKSDYDVYIKNYMNWEVHTPNIKSLQSTCLARNIHVQSEYDLFVKSGLKYKICKNTYHMFYVLHTEDIFVNFKRIPLYEKTVDRNNAFQTWLDSQNNASLDHTTRSRLQ